MSSNIYLHECFWMFFFFFHKFSLPGETAGEVGNMGKSMWERGEMHVNAMKCHPCFVVNLC